jgi:hypothetical protein
MMKPRSVVATIGALVYAFAGVIVLRFSLSSVVVAFREYWPEGSGGLGAVSIGISESLVELVLLVLPVFAIVTNRTLARWAHGSGGAGRAVHLAHTWTIVVAFALVIVAAVAFAVHPGPLLFVALPLDGVVWGVLFVLTAALLGVYAARSK